MRKFNHWSRFILLTASMGIAPWTWGDEVRSRGNNDGPRVLANWSDPETWEGGSVPGPDDTVTIGPNATVVFDTNAEVRRVSIEGGGTLTFSREKSTRLVIQRGSVVIENGGELFLGTAQDPIPRPHTAVLEVVVPEGQTYTGGPSVNPNNDFGVWVLGGATFATGGYPIRNTWTFLSETVPAGARDLPVESDVTDWQAGDKVIVSVLRRDFGPDNDLIDFRVKSTVSAVRPRGDGKGGSVLTLAEPIPWTALAESAFWGAVGNLTRNVVVRGRDANPHDRPHIWHRDGAMGNLFYTEFTRLGPMGDHHRPSDDSATPTDRYPVHYHTEQGEVVGCSLHDNGKNNIVFHRTHRALAFANVIGDTVMGTGIWTGPANNHPAEETRIWSNFVAFDHSRALVSTDRQSSTFTRPLYLSHPRQSVLGNYLMGGYYTVYAPFTEWQSGIGLEFQYNMMYSGTVGLLLLNYRPPVGSPEIKGNLSALHDYSVGMGGIANVRISDCVTGAGALTNWELNGENVTVSGCHIFSTPSPFNGRVHEAIGPMAGSPAFRLSGSGIRVENSWISGHYDYSVVDKPYCCEPLVQAEFENTAFSVDLPYGWWRPPVMSWGNGDQRPHRESRLRFRGYAGLYEDELGRNFETIPGFLDRPARGELTSFVRDGWWIPGE